MLHTYRILVRGLVQGVGFRPFIALLARELDVKGWVQNTSQGVEILAQAEKKRCNAFIKRIKTDAPSASLIDKVTFVRVDEIFLNSFTINKSVTLPTATTVVSPDIAVCPACLADMEKQKNRIRYPFINCTHCGPRFSIIHAMPYDRDNTSMKVFRMCTECRKEYEDLSDRRFHAQPVACHRCGPEYVLLEGSEAIRGMDVIMPRLNTLLTGGQIVAIKGIGGYHLSCDALNHQAVNAIRKRKSREAKPLAVMFRDMDALLRIVVCSWKEKEILASWRRPIVILRLKSTEKVAGRWDHITSGLDTLGVFLPYMPLHYMLFRLFPGPAIVLTSGNATSEPIIVRDHEAVDQFSGTAAAILVHNREIVNRCDDSVVRLINGKERVMRRSRGYAPLPVPIKYDVDNIVAFGAEQSGCFCVGKGNHAILSQYIGDLKTEGNQAFFREALGTFFRLYNINPALVVRDLHPAYFSGKMAEEFTYLPLISIQHHHAHIASCMAEHGLDECVIGVAFDGTGYGDDGKIWGGEFLVCDMKEYRRILHLEYLPLPGGDKAIEQPWRTATAYLYRIYGRNLTKLSLPVVRACSTEHLNSICNMIDQKVNCPEVSGAGRLFDAVAAITGLCLQSSFQAEAPMRLESQVVNGINAVYSYHIDKVISVDSMIGEIVEDLLSSVSVPIVATKFHNTIISIIFESVIAIAKAEKLSKVVLSGGVFQNRYILRQTEKMLKKSGFKVYSNERVPVNDGGIALGQMAIAAKRRESKCV
jgi:hydrogenase maturation protein HypF